ncbi:NOP58 family protein [Candidatus Woesearchaeota archaeon]|nr:NOP58 family protein [Candidatus Woesearchaeota archaeon]
MPKAIVKHLIGEFVVDQAGRIVNEKLAREPQDSQDAPPSSLLSALRDPKYRAYLRDFNLEITRRKITAAVSEDNFISQAINSVAELERSANQLSKRLREWYALYNPEFTIALQDNEKFAGLVSTKSRKELLADIKRSATMGADLKKEDLEQILGLAKTLHGLYRQRNEIHTYLEILLSQYAPNLKAIAGASIAAKLIEHTGSLKRLMLLPASTIQILGAEKALFRHLTTGARPPKFGYIMHHPFVAQANREEKGRRARQLADKLAMAAKVDYFKGDFIADRLKKELEEKAKLPRSKKPQAPPKMNHLDTKEIPSSQQYAQEPIPKKRYGEMRGFAPRKREERIEPGKKLAHPKGVFDRRFARQPGKPFPPRNKEERTEAGPKSPYPGAFKHASNRPENNAESPAQRFGRREEDAERPFKERRPKRWRK